MFFVEIYLDDQCSITGLSDISIEDFNDGDTANIFSDPESEWNGSVNVEGAEIFDHHQHHHDTRPESDQPEHELEPEAEAEAEAEMAATTHESTYMKPYTIPSMSYENLDDF